MELYEVDALGLRSNHRQLLTVVTEYLDFFLVALAKVFATCRNWNLRAGCLPSRQVEGAWLRLLEALSSRV